MNEPSKALPFVIVICLVIIGIFATYKIEAVIRSNNRPNTISDNVSLSVIQPDASFFDESSSLATTTPSPSLSINTVPTDGVSATAYIAADVVTGKIYAERSANSILPVASMSKLITAIAATDLLTPTTTITITTDEAAAPPDGSGIAAGETYTLEEILYPMLLDSSNIAAEAVASTTDRSHFIELMSSYAWEIGMSTAYFADPSGVNPHNAASAIDLLALAKYLYKFRPDILALTRTASTSVATTTEHGAHDFVSIHPFVRDPDFIGGKTGRTPQAGDTMLTIMNIGGSPIAVVVLGSKYDGREGDTRTIIDMVKKKIASH